MSLKAVLFDLDGTLLDTAPDFIRVLNRLLQEEHRAPLDNESIRNTVSSGASALVKLGFGLPESDPAFEPLRNRLLALYQIHLADETLPFPGITELLDFIRTHRLCWGIVTNKPWLYTAPLLEKMSFPLPPVAVVCPDHVTHRKPHPEPLLLACQQAHCTPAEAIYLGDHRRDIEAAQNAGMRSVACAFGYIEPGDTVKSWQANHIIAHPQDAIPLLQQLL